MILAPGFGGTLELLLQVTITLISGSSVLVNQVGNLQLKTTSLTSPDAFFTLIDGAQTRTLNLAWVSGDAPESWRCRIRDTNDRIGSKEYPEP